jgi:hypothetical protein
LGFTGKGCSLILKDFDPLPRLRNPFVPYFLFPRVILYAVDFETPVCKLYLLFLSANAAQEKEKKRKNCCCPLVFQPMQYMTNPSLPTPQ